MQRPHVAAPFLKRLFWLRRTNCNKPPTGRGVTEGRLRGVPMRRCNQLPVRFPSTPAAAATPCVADDNELACRRCRCLLAAPACSAAACCSCMQCCCLLLLHAVLLLAAPACSAAACCSCCLLLLLLLDAASACMHACLQRSPRADNKGTISDSCSPFELSPYRMPAFAFGNGLWYDGEIDEDSVRPPPRPNPNPAAPAALC